jgi:hypothetical protein
MLAAAQRVLQLFLVQQPFSSSRHMAPLIFLIRSVEKEKSFLINGLRSFWGAPKVGPDVALGVVQERAGALQVCELSSRETTP